MPVIVDSDKRRAVQMYLDRRVEGATHEDGLQALLDVFGERPVECARWARVGAERFDWGQLDAPSDPVLDDRPRAAASPGDLYRQQRQAGVSHAASVEEVCRAYSRHGEALYVEDELAAVRYGFEHPEPEPVAPEAEPEVDALATAAADARVKIRELEDAKARLSLDAFDEDEHVRHEAQLELGDVESELAAARCVVERAALAEGERERRREAEAAKLEADARAEAGREAAKLDGELQKLAPAVDKAARALGAAIAADRAVRTRRDERAARARGRDLGFQTGHPYQAAIHHALAEHGVANACEWPRDLDSRSLVPKD